MENRKSLLRAKSINVSSEIAIRIPTVGEILDDEERYYGIVQRLIATPYSMMVQLDDNGIDFTKISDFELFMLYSLYTFSMDLSVIFGDTFSKLRDVLVNEEIPYEDKLKALCQVKKKENDEVCLYDLVDDILIDKYIYEKMADAIRKINCIEKDNRKAGNDAARQYLIKKNRRYQNRHKNDEYKPFLENLVVALVNKQEFKYNYEEVMDLSIYKFNRSVKQIKHTVNFDKTMIGVYAGTVDTSKMTDKSVLSFIET